MTAIGNSINSTLFVPVAQQERGTTTEDVETNEPDVATLGRTEVEDITDSTEDGMKRMGPKWHKFFTGLGAALIPLGGWWTAIGNGIIGGANYLHNHGDE